MNAVGSKKERKKKNGQEIVKREFIEKFHYKQSNVTL